MKGFFILKRIRLALLNYRPVFRYKSALPLADAGFSLQPGLFWHRPKPSSAN